MNSCERVMMAMSNQEPDRVPVYPVLAEGNILRLKGFVNAGEGSFAVNCTAQELCIEPCGRQPAMINVIGRQIDRRAVKAVPEKHRIQ